MTYDEFKLCRKCPTHSRVFDSDGYWCCKHPDAGKQSEYDKNELYEPGDEVPVVCLKTCPCGHWKLTIEGGKIPKAQTELVIDAEWIP